MLMHIYKYTGINYKLTAHIIHIVKPTPSCCYFHCRQIFSNVRYFYARCTAVLEFLPIYYWVFKKILLLWYFSLSLSSIYYNKNNI